MPELTKKITSRLQNFWFQSSRVHRILMAGLSVSVLVIFVLMMFWINRPNYRILYSRLNPGDAARIVEVLKKAKVDYKLTDGGSTVLVPADRVYDLRLEVAGENVIQGEGVGFEIFDEVKIGQTEFVQRINYQRAMQGELSRTISEFPEIENARVHLVMPSRSLFIEEQVTPSASVVLDLTGGQKPDSKKVNAIVNLVASSVEGLSTDNITVTDTAGRLLYQPRPDGSFEGMTSTQLEYKLNLQENLERRIEQLLTPVIGPGKVIARVNADLDFSQRTIYKESYDPDSVVVRSEQTSEETTTGTSSLEAGVPEPQYQGGAGQATGSVNQQESTRTQSTTNFEINKEEENIVVPTGKLQRLSVAVIVDGMYEKPEGADKPVFAPRSDQELAKIRELVKNAVGLDEIRGDSLEVSSIAFGLPEEEPEPGMVSTIFQITSRMAKPMLNAVLVILFLFLVARPIVMALIRPRVEEEGLVRGRLPEGEERIALEEAELEREIPAKRLADFKEQANQLVEKNMDQAVALIRQWLKESEA